jgi:hypothetical protein
MYGAFPYFIAKSLTDFPIIIVAPMLQLLLSYWSLGFIYSEYGFWSFYMTLFLTA